MPRFDALITALNQSNIPAALYHSSTNIRYISGYTGEGCMLLTPDARYIITDFRYIEQAERESPDYIIKRVGNGESTENYVKQILSSLGIDTLGIEAGVLTLSAYRALEAKLEGIKLVDLPPEAEKLREIKDSDEIERIVKAAKIACAAFDDLLGALKPGMTEKQVRAELEYLMCRRGSEGAAFDTIIASGTNGSLPHAVPTDKPLNTGELVTLDFGATYKGYKCDMTRTIAIGDVSAELKKIYMATLEAQTLALDMIAPGVKCNEVDKRARDYLEALYPGAFGHGLGHGVGLLIHEAPGVNTRSDTVLKKGHVVTVEPGIYLPGVGGCRIEDMAILTDDGYINPITAPKQLLVI